MSGTERACGDISKTSASLFVKSAFGVLEPDSYLSLIHIYHAELVTDDLEEAFFKSEEEQALRKAIQQHYKRRLLPLQSVGCFSLQSSI